MSRTAWLSFVVKRLLLAIPVAWGTVTLLFLVFFALPGDRVDRVLTGERFVSADVRAAVTERYGLDRPLHEQYVGFWRQLSSGDLGESYVNGQSVSDIIATAAPASARLAFWALVIQLLLGVTAALVAAVRRSAFVQTFTLVTTVFLISVPAFVIGHLLQLAFGVMPFQNGLPSWAVLPVQGLGPDQWAFGVIPLGDQWRYLILPALTVSAATTALLVRTLSVTMRTELASDVIRGARAKGLSNRRVYGKVLRLAAGPVIVFTGVELVGIFGSAVITETVFAWPGLGIALGRALTTSDAPVILGITLLLVLTYVVVNLVTDVIHRLVDPRVGRT